MDIKVTHKNDEMITKIHNALEWVRKTADDNDQIIIANNHTGDDAVGAEKVQKILATIHDALIAIAAQGEDGRRQSISGFSYKNEDDLCVFIQYKNTNICMDFHCECGAFCHYDGYFAHTVKCPHCETVWEMPIYLYPRKACAETYEGHRNNPQMLEPYEDFEKEDDIPAPPVIGEK